MKRYPSDSSLPGTMMRRPHDFNERAFQSVAILTASAPPDLEPEPEDPIRAAALLGRKGGLKGGKARAADRAAAAFRAVSARSSGGSSDGRRASLLSFSTSFVVGFL